MSLPAVAPPADRLEALGRQKSVRRKPEGGPPELTAKHRLLIEYQIYGCGHPDVCARIVVERQVQVDGMSATVQRHPLSHEPLSLIEAADLLRIRRRNARELAGLKVYRSAFEAELEKYRNGERFASVKTIVDIRDDAGAGKAADRKVRLEASKALLGEDFQTKVTVGVQVNNTMHVTPGIVVRRYQPREADVASSTIEHVSASGREHDR